MTDETIKQIQLRIKEGKLNSEIMKEFNITYDMLRKIKDGEIK